MNVTLYKHILCPPWIKCATRSLLYVAPKEKIDEKVFYLKHRATDKIKEIYNNDENASILEIIFYMKVSL